MKNILVTGGAGYIGATCVMKLCDLKYNVFVIDNLSKGDKKYVDTRSQFAKIDLLDKKKLNNFVKNKNIDLVIHFASNKAAGESMENASKYSENIICAINLLDVMVENKIPKIIFSSSAAVYGNPNYIPVDEKHIVEPINYYGYTKLCIENMIFWYKKIHNIQYTILRYFNVVGNSSIKYIEKDAKNLFPIILDVIQNKKSILSIFGNDYDTTDGTCIRDYIHINDLVDAHLLSIEKGDNEIFNLGSENGYSVLDVVNEFEKQLKQKINKQIIKRRIGDPERLIASSDKAKKVLGWKIKHNLSHMIKNTVRS